MARVAAACPTTFSESSLTRSLGDSIIFKEGGFDSLFSLIRIFLLVIAANGHIPTTR
jgi:hypothetical protein